MPGVPGRTSSVPSSIMTGVTSPARLPVTSSTTTTVMMGDVPRFSRILPTISVSSDVAQVTFSTLTVSSGPITGQSRTVGLGCLLLGCREQIRGAYIVLHSVNIL
jgi:hypothetical protein